MNQEKVKAFFLKLLEKKDATPYIPYIKAGISETEKRIRSEYSQSPPECVYMYAAALALLIYTNAECAGDITVCSPSGEALLSKDTSNIRQTVQHFADHCLSLCSRYLIDDKFVIISTKIGGKRN